jgi:hypothetical protein
MLATDVLPNRLQRAKFAIMNFVQRHANGRVGLVAFAGSAFLQCPLTFDYEAFEDALRDLDERTIPIGGTDIGRALNEAVSAMDANSRRKLVVLLTDGEDLEKSGVTAAETLAKTGATIYTIGVGTEAGAELPTVNAAGQMDVVRDPGGRVVRSQLDEKTLTQVATAGGGNYYSLGRLGEGLLRVREHMRAAHKAGAARTRSEAIDRYHIPLAALVLLLAGESLLGTRRRQHRVDRPTIAKLRSLATPLTAASLVLMASGLPIFANTTNEAVPDIPVPAPKSARDFYNAGTRQLANKKLAEAESLLKKALSQQDDHIQPQALFNLGHVRFQQGAAELEKSPGEAQVARRMQSAEQAAAAAVATAQSALADNQVEQLVDAYQRGRVARREIKAARDAVKQALEAYAKTLERWQRALGDLRSVAELAPHDSNAATNIAQIERAIADVIDRARRLLQMTMQNAPGPRPRFNELMEQLKGRIPADRMPPGAPGDDEEDDGGFLLDLLKNQTEAPGREGNEQEIPLSREDAARLLDGMRLDSNRRLPMTSPTGQPGPRRNPNLRDW